MRQLILFVLLAAPAWGSTYYVRGDGSAASKAGATSCSAASTAMSVTTHNAQTFSPGDSIVLCIEGGNIAGPLTPPTAGSAGNLITYDSDGLVKVVGSSSVYSLVDNVGYLSFAHIWFDQGGVSTSNAPGTVFYSCLFTSAQGKTGLITSGTSSTTALYNNVFSANDQHGLYLSGGTGTVTNNVFVGNGVEADATNGQYYNVRVGSGPLTSNYNLYLGGSRKPANNYYGFTPGANDQLEAWPAVNSLRTQSAVFTFSSDDYDTAFWTSVAASLNPMGVYLTFFPGPIAGDVPITDWSAMSALVAAGNEVGIHSYTHSDLVPAYLFTVTTTNASPSITIDATNALITLSTTTLGNTVTMAAARDKLTINDLVTATTGKGWTIAMAANDYPYITLYSLADSGGAQSSLPYNALADMSAPRYGFWDQELRRERDYIQAQIGVTPVLFAPPAGYTNTSLQAYVKNVLGLLALRDADQVGMTGTMRMDSYNVYDMDGDNISVLIAGDTTQAQFKASMDHAIAYANSGPSAYHIFFHHIADVTPQQLVWMVTELQARGATIKTMHKFVTDLEADHSTADGFTYTKTYPDISDYRLTAASPLINAGSSLASTYQMGLCPTAIQPTTFCNQAYYGSGWEIGPYVSAGSGSVLTDYTIGTVSR